MSDTMTANFSAVNELNRVEGFDPASVVRRISETLADGTVTERYYLDVAYRKLWFRLKHPEGAIRKFVREITDRFAIVEAKIYLDRKDPEDSYIANAIVKRYFAPDDKFGDKYLELAETAAVGRALADAGFGIQFADASDVPDTNVVDSPFEMPNGTEVNTITGEVMHTPKASTANTGKAQSVSAPEKSGLSQTGQASPDTSQSITQDMSVEEILPKMTLEYATHFVVDCGIFSGKMLGQVATEKPSCLEWYVNSYKGKNNILRAAAKYLLDAANAG